MAKAGEQLQKLVKLIEGAINNAPHISVESPKRLRDKDTKRLREHDVVVTITQNHHKIQIALECRDRGRKVGVPDIEAFYQKCQRTSIDKAIVVSSSGFTATALTKSASYNIDCLTLDEAAKLDWCATNVMQVNHRHILQTNITVTPPDELDAKASQVKLFEKPDKELNPAHLNQLAFNLLSKIPYDLEAPINTPNGHSFIIQNIDSFYLQSEAGMKYELKGMRVDITWEYRVRNVPLTFHIYKKTGEKNDLATTATGVFSLGDDNFELAMVNKADTGIQVLISHKKLLVVKPSSAE